MDACKYIGIDRKDVGLLVADGSAATIALVTATNAKPTIALAIMSEAKFVAMFSEKFFERT